MLKPCIHRWTLFPVVRQAVRLPGGECGESWRLPSAHGAGLKSLFNDARKRSCHKSGSFKCGASEALSFYEPFRSFVRTVCRDGRHAEQVLSGLSLACSSGRPRADRLGIPCIYIYIYIHICMYTYVYMCIHIYILFP